MYNFEEQKKEWERLPVDEQGYLSAEELIAMPDSELLRTIDQAREQRFTGWRNHNNMWRETLGHDTTKGKKIIDFGCGIGIESLEFAKENEVWVADINKPNLELVKKVFELKGMNLGGTLEITNTYPFVDTDQKFDIFYCNGVLHHIEYAFEVMKRAFELAPEVRLMLYSDIARSRYNSDQDFIRDFDAVGQYSDSYSRATLEEKFGSLGEITKFDYITTDSRYLTVTLKKK